MTAQTAVKIIRALRKEYPGATTSLAYNNPINLLVATILSAQCTDKMVNKVTPRLFQKYKSARDYADADIRTLMGEIRSIGLYKGKARNIKKMARKISKDFAGKVPRSIDELVLLPGVGRKTANIVLSNAFGIDQGIAVDTHVRRLSKKIGLTNKDIPDKIEQDLIKIVPTRYWGTVNRLLVSHGRAVCRAVNPAHDACCIRRFCRWYKENV